MSNIDINVEAQGGVLEIREGKALPLYNQEVVEFNGVIDSPLRFLEKRVDTLNQLECHIIVDRSEMSITLNVDEHSHFKDVVKGFLELSDEFKNFGINAGTYRTTLEMAEFIKMHRACFENRAEAMDLVYKLRKFKAKVDKDVEAEYQPNKGDKRILIQQVVDSNVPEAFNVYIPLFKGGKKEIIELETYFNPEDMTCTLVSPQANDLIVDFKDHKIDEILSSIKEIAPNIVIFEQ